MYTLQTLPVLEPYELFDFRGKSFLYVSFDLFLGFFGGEAGDGIVFELEFGPDDEVHDVWVDAVRPVVV